MGHLMCDSMLPLSLGRVKHSSPGISYEHDFEMCVNKEKLQSHSKVLKPLGFASLIPQRIRMQNLSIVQLGVLAGKEHKARRDFAGLADAPESTVLAKLLHLLSWAGRRLQRCVYGARSDRVDPDALGHELRRQ